MQERRLDTPLHGRIAWLARDASGGIAIMAAFFLMLIVGAAALAIDGGHLVLAKRQTQTSADLAAIAAVRTPSQGLQAARVTAHRNGVPEAADVQVEWGSYEPDPDLSPADRFEPSGSTAPGGAARVTIRRDVPLFFGGLFVPSGNVEVVAQGVAARRDEAGISIGSSLLTLDEGILNQLLSGLTGSSISLSAVHYDALVGADVNLLTVLDSLATSADLTAFTYDDVLDAEVTVAEILDAAATSTDSSSAQAALSLLWGQIDVPATVQLSSIIDLGSIGELAIGDGSRALHVGLFDLLRTTLETANGENQIALDTGLSVPGLADVEVDLAIGERPQGLPWLAVGERGVTVRTAQVRLRLEAIVLGADQAAASLLTSLLGGVVEVDPVRVPLYVEVAPAEARFESVSCDTQASPTPYVTVAARTGVAEAWLGDIDPNALKYFTSRPQVEQARLVAARLKLLLLTIPLSVDAEAHTNVGNPGERLLTFDRVGQVEEIGSYGLTESLMSSLLQNLEPEVAPLNLLGGLVGQLSGTLASALSPVTNLADAIVDPLLEALGVRIGGADVELEYVACGNPRLVM